MLHLEKLNVIQDIFVPQMCNCAPNLLQIAELKLQVVDLVLVLLIVYNIIKLLENLIVSIDNPDIRRHLSVKNHPPREARMGVEVVNHIFQTAGLLYELFQSHFFKS